MLATTSSSSQIRFRNVTELSQRVSTAVESAADSACRDHTVVQTKNCRACGSDKQRRQQRVDNARETSTNHGDAKLQCVSLVFPITLTQRARVVREKAAPEAEARCTPNRR